ncbi:MAG TPA: AAA family ATPase [Noviherbaspirillum sp.]|nr:AAA family ATPase [Noviherbaspirillum sp.]
MEPTTIILHGPTSSGKTSLAKALQANALVPAFHISLDAFVTMSRRRDMRSDEEQRHAYHIHCENLRSTLARVADTQFDIILDFVLRDEAELQACFDVLSRRPTYVVRVCAPLHILEERERGREDRASGMAREQIGHPAFQRTYDFTIDTSTCTPEEGASAIRRFIRERSRMTSGVTQ